MLIGSLVELHVGLHSCLCFSHLEKLFLKSLLNTSSIASYLSRFLSFFLSQSRQHLDTWWIDRASVLDSDVLFLDTSWTPQLSTSIFSTPTRQIPRYLSIPASVEIYQLHYIRALCDPEIIFFDLSLDTSLFSLPKHSHLSLNLFLQDSSRFFKFFFTW